MIAGWTPINYPIIRSLTDSGSTNATSTTTTTITTEEQVNGKANSKRARTPKAKKVDSNAPKIPRKRAGGKSQNPPKRQRKLPRKKGSSDEKEHGNANNQMLATESDVEYGLDEPFPELETLSDLPSGSNGNTAVTTINSTSSPTELVMISVVPDTRPVETYMLLSGTYEEDHRHSTSNDPRHEWSESTVVTENPWNLDSTSATLSDLGNHGQYFSDDEYGDLDDDDLACLDMSSDTLGHVEPSRKSGSMSSTPRSILMQPCPSLSSPCASHGLPGVNASPEHLKEGQKTNQKHSILESSPTSSEKIQPTVRPPFPLPIRDRSPLIGFSSSTSLRTCFRIGEAINVGSRAIKDNKDIVIEIYARVNSSHRDESSLKQHFQLLDMYHDRPPYLNATYDLWKDNDLWEKDSRVFLQQSNVKKLCRCIGRMKKDEHQKLVLQLLNIWEATLQNAEYTKGIICG
jgi:hypothetical protein